MIVESKVVQLRQRLEKELPEAMSTRLLCLHYGSSASWVESS